MSEQLIARLQQDNQRLRRMLALAYSGLQIYGDDGELQDNSCRPFIDFVRDSVDEIERKIMKRGLDEYSRTVRPGNPVCKNALVVDH